jgi:hypothetical protein
MSKPGRRARRQARREQGEKEKGPCFVEECGARGSVGQECELCLKKGKQFKLQACRSHTGDARARMKRHILLKHPGVMPAWFAAAMTGEDMV